MKRNRREVVAAQSLQPPMLACFLSLVLRVRVIRRASDKRRNRVTTIVDNVTFPVKFPICPVEAATSLVTHIPHHDILRLDARWRSALSHVRSSLVISTKTCLTLRVLCQLCLEVLFLLVQICFFLSQLVPQRSDSAVRHLDSFRLNEKLFLLL